MYTNDELWKNRLRHRRVSWPRDLREEFISILDTEIKSHSAHYQTAKKPRQVGRTPPDEPTVTRTTSLSDLEFKVDLEEFDFPIEHSPLVSDLDSFLHIFRQKPELEPTFDTSPLPSPPSSNSSPITVSPITIVSQPAANEGTQMPPAFVNIFEPPPPRKVTPPGSDLKKLPECPDPPRIENDPKKELSPRGRSSSQKKIIAAAELRSPSGSPKREMKDPHELKYTVIKQRRPSVSRRGESHVQKLTVADAEAKGLVDPTLAASESKSNSASPRERSPRTTVVTKDATLKYTWGSLHDKKEKSPSPRPLSGDSLSKHLSSDPGKSEDTGARDTLEKKERILQKSGDQFASLSKIDIKPNTDESSQAKARQLYSSTFSVALKRVLTASVGVSSSPHRAICNALGEISQQYLYAFLWNFDMFMSPHRLLHVVILFYRIDNSMLAITFLVEWVKLRSSSLFNKREWVELFFSFIGYLNTGSTEEQISHGRLLKRSWDFVEKRQEIVKKMEIELAKDLTDSRYSILDFDPTHIASQLTFLNQWRCWTRRGKSAYAHLSFREIDRIIEWFNQVCCWVASSIIRTEGPPKARASVMIQWIKVMLALFDVSNFESLMAVYLAFELHPVRQLKEEWKLLPKPMTIHIKMIEGIMSPNRNYQAFRQHLASINKFKPFVPIIAVLLKDLTVFEENKTMFDEATVNWSKLSAVAQLFETIRLATVSFTQLPFLHEIQKLINHGVAGGSNLEELYKLSVPNNPYPKTRKMTMSKLPFGFLNKPSK